MDYFMVKSYIIRDTSQRIDVLLVSVDIWTVLWFNLNLTVRTKRFVLLTESPRTVNVFELVRIYHHQKFTGSCYKELSLIYPVENKSTTDVPECVRWSSLYPGKITPAHSCQIPHISLLAIKMKTWLYVILGSKYDLGFYYCNNPLSNKLVFKIDRIISHMLNKV